MQNTDQDTPTKQAQTPEQRRRNEKFYRDQAAKRGKSDSEVQKRAKGPAQNSPISPIWLLLLGFVVFGGLIFEVLSRIFGGRSNLR
ncbi:uncharacterized protein MKZ38_005260 [Zalerion maritima]|uniref:Stress-associated endoplasmic reticulum protein n=1 Tax=Zalerion maritima TaxID=339359 RepID=A0AAD5WP26_9PEZI|nr:uncharacterized protein MKZ38_005260 [Zalerion maritima]